MRQYEHLTDEEIQDKLMEWEHKRHKAFDLGTMEEFEKELRRLGEMYYGYVEEQRMRAKGKMRPYEDWEAEECKMTLKRFVQCCKNGLFTDYDGSGRYATDTEVSDITISPSDVTDDYYRKDFTHVCWYNK